MIWAVCTLLCCLWAPAAGHETPERAPFFHGHVFENSPAASKVNGLSIPVRRIKAQKWCPVPGMHLKVDGDGSQDFRAFAHHRRGNILLKTSRVLDREVRSEYLLRVALCCHSCAPDSALVDVASVKVNVLDTNDHEPTFRPPQVAHITLDDTTAIRSVVYRLSAVDADSGKNADLTYASSPKNGTFYVVPKTGEVLLLDSILGLRCAVEVSLFATDHGWPPLRSERAVVTFSPRRWLEKPAPERARRAPRASLYPAASISLNVSEDASIGSVITSLSPNRFQSAGFELIYPDSQSSPVSVGHDTGDITITRRLDRESQPSVDLTVKIQDKLGPDWYLNKVKLTITDVNDNVPEWKMKPYPYQAGVSPDATAGTFVYQLQALDGDEGRSGEVEYFLADGGDGCFAVDKKTGQVATTNQKLQRDREYLLGVVAIDGFGGRSAPAMLSVVAGARPPQFTDASYSISIPENTPEGQPFLAVFAISFQKQPISYSLLINPSSLFHIQQESGEISLTRTLDYESDQRRYLLMVRASEELGSLSTATEVQVLITDENDCVPEFLQSIYSVDGVPETVTTATSVLQVMATDCDSGLNAELTYYTLSPDFSISPHGTIFPAVRLDYERPNHIYEFVVMVVDGGDGPHSGTATVRVRMVNVNDEAPEFSQLVYRTFVSEDAGPNTLVATVLAKDPDGDGIIYSITAGNEEGNFVIDSQKGLIRLRSTPLPKLQGLEYILNVTATDDNASGGLHPLSSTARIIVGVDDVNNNKPIFEECQQYREQASVLENQPTGTFVLQVHAVDADEGANGKVKYGLMHRDSAMPAFRIHPDSGAIVTAQRFDRERQREYSVTVTATDWAEEPLIGICQLTVQILDENDNSPKFENMRYEYFLREDTLVGTSFLRVAAHDADFGTNAVVAYAMSMEQPEYLKVNAVTGWVYVNQPISQRSYITRDISGTDGGNKSTSVELAVTITNVKNQPPQWEEESYSVIIPENTARDTPITTIKATSQLGDPRVTYNLEDGMVPETNMPVRFYLSPNREDGSASILVSEPLDYETNPSFSLRVRAQNVAAVPLAAFTTVYVNITDVNDNVPFFTSSIYEASVTEGAQTGTSVLQVSANDKDLGPNGEITYSLLSDNSGDHHLFRIEPKLGVIYTEAVFDREARSSYLLEVQSVDGQESARPGKNKQPNSDTAYVRVFISDVNDNKPAFVQRLYEVAVDEDADVGLAVVTVSANDEDEGANAKLRYQITSGNKGGVFDIEPEVGTIFIAQPLDYEQQKRYKLLVLASDGKWEDYAAAVVTVVNKNDEAPVFSMNEYYGSITEELEGSPVFVLQVTAIDPDKDADQGAIRYSIHGQGAESHFMINDITGEMYAQRTMDREERAVWRFVVMATDEAGEGLTGFTDVIINVWDINDNSPTFSCLPDNCLSSIRENSPPGTFVVEMTAVDLDDAAVGQNAILTYQITENVQNTNNEDLFTMDSSTGTISVASDGLDRELVDSYRLVVEACDGGGMASTATATIILTDINDHVPKFQEEMCAACVPENADVDTTILELGAMDPDAGAYGQLAFSVIDGDPEQQFYMDHGNGSATLTALRRFDRERQSKFLLPVVMIDSGYPPMTATSTLTITIGDQNDNAHQAGEKDIYVYSRIGRMVNVSLGKVHAIDPDDWDNKTYTLETSAAKYFRVNQSSGLLTIRQNAPVGSYWMRVGVSDGVWPDVMSGVRVHVRDLEEKAVLSSASLRLTGITTREFIDSHVERKSRLETLLDFLSEALSVRAGNINIFSIADRGEKSVDIHFYVLSDTGYVHSEKLHGVLAAHKKKLQSLLHVNMSQVQVDECVHADCKASGGCATQLTVGESPTLVDADALSLVSVKVTTSAVCGCTAREMTHQSCSSYSNNPCLNGGTCIDAQNGYRCQCPPQHDGPDCQQTRRSFLGNGYTWFPPMKPCFDSHLSLEFMTEEDDGLLLYAGPLATLLPGDVEDFMAIELIGGAPSLKINHGSGTLVLQLISNAGLSDRRWHRLDVRSNSKEVRFTMDRCSTAIVMETEGVDSWAMTEDRSSCEIRGITPNWDKYLNASHVLQLGGVNVNSSYEYPQLQHKHYIGCIRNLRLDSKLYDLGSPAESVNSVPGCYFMDDHCTNTERQEDCDKTGRCDGEWGPVSCQCESGFTGPECDQPAPEFSFDGRSHVQFQLLWSLPARQIRVQAGIRTRAAFGVILSLLSQEQSEYLRLEVVQGLLAVFYNLGDGDYNLTLPFHNLDDGEWHELELDRFGREFTLRVDGGGGRREIMASPGRSQEIIIDPSVVMLGNSFPSGHNRSFLGCMRDLRFSGRSVSLDREQPSEGLQVVSAQGVSLGCSSEACRKHPCSPPLVCVDLWRQHECRCPPGHITKQSSSGKTCIYTLCASRPCRYGTCVAHSPSRYTCQCNEGYRGRHCEVTLAMFHNEDGNSLSLSSMFAISICVTAFLVLMLGLFLYSCWRRHKDLKEGVYHVSAHHSEWEDIRENVLNYDEEGGGEQDQNAFNMVELQRSLHPSSAQSLRYSYPQGITPCPEKKPPREHNRKGMCNGNGSAIIALRLAVPPSETETLSSPLTLRRSKKPLSFSSQDLARYLCEVIRDMEHPEELGTRTTPRHPSGKERGRAPVRSLSASQGSEIRNQGAQSSRMDKFRTLRVVVSDLRGDSKPSQSQRDKAKESRGQVNCGKSG
ncbi:putative neural-cadherin 2 isoform X2 [Phycodurus eques]|uniref:putative neural-cadherin 2 isoform X2 n=1 Tax=Phycodurus eques TaxID=693459 RepID=UPI002ACD7A18|nr:putative neural-cadherin 2 isoform X2 [Phycodurus eques]